MNREPRNRKLTQTGGISVEGLPTVPSLINTSAKLSMLKQWRYLVSKYLINL
jgi:hypothetical protein